MADVALWDNSTCQARCAASFFFSPHTDSEIKECKTVSVQFVKKVALGLNFQKEPQLPKFTLSSTFKAVSFSTEKSTLSAGPAAENSHGP